MGGVSDKRILLNKERALSLVEAGLSRICLSMDAISATPFAGSVREVR